MRLPHILVLFYPKMFKIALIKNRHIHLGKLARFPILPAIMSQNMVWKPLLFLASLLCNYCCKYARPILFAVPSFTSQASASLASTNGVQAGVTAPNSAHARPEHKLNELATLPYRT